MTVRPHAPTAGGVAAKRLEAARLGALSRAQAEVEADRPWRAKEILRGSLANPSQAVDPDLLEFFGALLDRLGDRLEAGKLLYLSGRREERYEAAIALFLDRNRALEGSRFVAQLPRAVRFQGLGSLPEVVRQDLAERGVSAEDLARSEPIAVPPAVKDDVDGYGFPAALLVGCLTVLLLLASTWFVGCVTILGWATE